MAKQLDTITTKLPSAEAALVRAAARHAAVTPSMFLRRVAVREAARVIQRSEALLLNGK